MKLTWSFLEGKKQVVLLSFDGEPWKRVHSSIISPAIFKPDYLSLEEAEGVLYDLELKGAKRYALKRLSLKSYSSSELAKILKIRFVSSAAIDEVLEDCRALGALNDLEWGEAFVRGCLNKKFGLRAIAQKLRQKGIPPSQIEEFLASAPLEQEKNGLERLLSTRYARRDLSNRKEREKTIQALMRKGYSYSLIIEAMGEASRH